MQQEEAMGSQAFPFYSKYRVQAASSSYLNAFPIKSRTGDALVANKILFFLRVLLVCHSANSCLLLREYNERDDISRLE